MVINNDTGPTTNSLENINKMLNSSYIGRIYKYYEVIDSTNDEAKRLCKSKNTIKSGTVLLSEIQTKGKGKENRAWFSSKGASLTFSIIIKNNFSNKNLSLFPLVIGAAVCSALRMKNIDGNLKWPNDIYIGSKKIGGILCERTINSSASDYIIIGIGININTQKEVFPDSIKDTAGSILSETKIMCNRKELLCLILQSIEKYIDIAYVQNDTDTILKYVRNYSNTINKDIILIKRDGSKVSAFAENINKLGKLIINIDGSLHEIVSGEVSLKLN